MNLLLFEVVFGLEGTHTPLFEHGLEAQVNVEV